MLMPTAIICLSHGAYIRNVLYSPMYEELSNKFNLVLVLPGGTKVPEENKAILRGARVVIANFQSHKFEKIFLFLRKNVFAGRERTQSFNIISEIERKKRPIVYSIASLLNSFFGRFSFIACWWQKCESFFISGVEFFPLILEAKPAIVITANYGTEGLEIRLLRAAHAHDIPTLSIVPSWDNLSSKGVIGEKPKKLAVWNEIMVQEASALYGFHPKDVRAVGGLQFDSYAQEISSETCHEVLKSLGLDLAAPYIVIGTITPNYFPHNLEIIDMLIMAVSESYLPADLQILVRLHPQVVGDPVYGDDLEAYRARAAKYSFLKLSIPIVYDWGVIRPPAADDANQLAVILSNAAVAIMPASTLALDGCVLGCPIIGIGFDGFETKPYEKSVRRTFDFTHYRRIVMEGGIRIAESHTQLLEEILSYLNNRERDRSGREKTIGSHLCYRDGRAWQRILEMIHEMTLNNEDSVNGLK